ncbi:biotin/lipoyl-binding carrier protein [Tuberibacillus sp. Marseille-P3662]|uniref:biotin/lipoyl-binding carrier protein n=1 Tax=Tuberibacillus sp. Marseille-P3662 TaxID=1965358 RepID=UPI000A1C7BA4|nr:biotin/lipoyl-binding carrier protein [Tuberibacillus sp. Marseille-P3662]
MKEIKANMAGTVLDVLVSEGDAVKKGDTVVMLESMKMEIPMESETDGSVKAVNVASQDFVNEGDVLLALEDQS